MRRPRGARERIAYKIVVIKTEKKIITFSSAIFLFFLSPICGYHIFQRLVLDMVRKRRRVVEEFGGKMVVEEAVRQWNRTALLHRTNLVNPDTLARTDRGGGEEGHARVHTHTQTLTS